MSPTVRSSLASALVLLASAAVQAQPDKPAPFVPLKASTRQELDRAEALKLYGLGLLHERKNHLRRAAEAFEEALRLDPDGAPSCKQLIAVYLALDRVEDALDCCRRALELDPGDFETAYRYARQLRSLGRPREARAAYEKAAGCAGLKGRPDLRAQVWFDLGVLCEEAGDWGRAERSFREVADVLDSPGAILAQGPYSRDEINARAAETCERLGQACLRAGHPDRAVAAFEKARHKDPGRATRLAYNLARVYAGQGKLEEALGRLGEYLRTQPQGTEGYELKIDLQRRLGRGDRVLPDLEAAAEADRHNAALWLLLAREYRRAGQAGKAEAVYLQLLAESPTPEVYRGLLGLYREDVPQGAEKALARLDGAVKAAAGDDARPGDAAQAAHARAMLEVLRGDPAFVRRLLAAARVRLLRAAGFSPAVLQRADLGYQTRMLLATLAARTRQLDVAEQLYRSCLVGGRRGLRGIEQEVYGGLLRVLALQHKNAEVVAVATEGLKTAEETSRVMLYVDLAQAQVALGRVQEALAAADAAVNAAPEKHRLFCRRVRVDVLSQAGRHARAVAEARALLREYNQPGEVREVRATLSAAYSAAHESDKAQEQLRLILGADPNDATANNDLGYQLADQGKELDEAERMIRKALELDRRQRGSGTAVGADGDEDNAAYVDSLGWVLFRRGRLEEARRELERAASLPGGDDDPTVWDHLGDVRFRQGDRRGAGEAWKKALALYDAGARRPAEDRYREIRQKLKLLEP